MARLDRQPRPAAVSDDQTPQQVAAPRYIRFTCQKATNSSLPAIAGADETSDLVLAMRSAPESSSRDENLSALRTDLRQRMPAVGAGSLTIFASSHDGRKKKKEAERRTTRVGTNRTSRRGTRFAKRARHSAFHHGSVPMGLFIPRLNLG
jgi:hypothetical protein